MTTEYHDRALAKSSRCSEFVKVVLVFSKAQSELQEKAWEGIGPCGATIEGTLGILSLIRFVKPYGKDSDH